MRSQIAVSVAVLVVSVSVLSCDCLLSTAPTAPGIKWVGECPLVDTNVACPDSAYVTFYLHTRSHPTEGQVIDLISNNLTSSNFSLSRPTKIIVHGLNCSSKDWHFVAMRKEFLLNGDYNLISVDWLYLAQASTLLCYPTTALNAKHVGACTGGLLAALRGAGVSDIHVIGHSLGAHIAGYAAIANLPYLLPRITALDPLPWLFASSFNDRLRPELASFVDVIHTLPFNILTAGHVDFYVNGPFFQPGCPINDNSTSVFECSHWRSVLYFSESINSVTGFYGWSCPSFSATTGGVCLFHGDQTILMGNSASPSTRGVVQVPTNSAPPFAKGCN